MKSIALFFSICLLSGQAGAQEMKMHRKMAGQPDPSGWMLAASTEGRFSVRLPLKFNDFTTHEPYPSPVNRTYAVGARSSDETAFVATRIVYRNGAESARQYFAGYEKGEGLGQAPERVAKRQIGALRAVDLVLKKPASVRFQRVLLLDSDLLILSVEFHPSHEAAVQPLAARFFDSLQVDAK
jgi:hypothetical protein